MLDPQVTNTRSMAERIGVKCNCFQARKGGPGSVTHETEEAEELLLVNKPLSLLISPLTQLVRH